MQVKYMGILNTQQRKKDVKEKLLGYLGKKGNGVERKGKYYTAAKVKMEKCSKRRNRFMKFNRENKETQKAKILKIEPNVFFFNQYRIIMF